MHIMSANRGHTCVIVFELFETVRLMNRFTVYRCNKKYVMRGVDQTVIITIISPILLPSQHTK